MVGNCENNDTVVANSRRQWAVLQFGDFVCG